MSVRKILNIKCGNGGKILGGNIKSGAQKSEIHTGGMQLKSSMAQM